MHASMALAQSTHQFSAAVLRNETQSGRMYSPAKNMAVVCTYSTPSPCCSRPRTASFKTAAANETGVSQLQRSAGSKGSRGRSRTGVRAIPVTRVYAQSSDEQQKALKVKAQELDGELKGSSIFLVGMMGSGKTTVGQLVAEALGYLFLDCDAVLEQVAGVTISEIFAENGEEYFRDRETEVLKELALAPRCVVATGGGAVLRPTNWGYLRQGVTVWLDGSPSTLAKRCVDVGTKSRPLLSGKAGAEDKTEAASTSYDEELEKTTLRLTSMLEARRPKYENADVRVALEEGDNEAVHAIPPLDTAFKVVDSIHQLLQRKRRNELRAKGELWKEFGVDL